MKKRKGILFALSAMLILGSCGSTGTSGSGDTAQNPESQNAESTSAVSGSAENESAESESTVSDSVLNHVSGKSEIQYKDGIPYMYGEIYAMDTYMSITCYGDRCEEAVDACLDEIIRLDDMLSVGNADSEIAQINANGSGTVSDDTASMISLALDLNEKTNGYYDITVYPLMELWGFTTQEYKVPTEAEIKDTLQYVGGDKVDFDESSNMITLNGAKGIDLGGIAKGFTSDRLMQIFAEYNLTSGMVSLGGNVQVYKTKTDGSLWRCGIIDPNDPDNGSAMLGIISLQDSGIITSGGYERFFTDEDTGKTYHHIIDPHTGYPSESGILSATIVSSSGVLADGLSTSVYAMGLDKSVEFWQKWGSDLGFDMILMTDDSEVYVTEPIADQFTSDYHINIIS